VPPLQPMPNPADDSSHSVPRHLPCQPSLYMVWLLGGNPEYENQILNLPFKRCAPSHSGAEASNIYYKTTGYSAEMFCSISLLPGLVKYW